MNNKAHGNAGCSRRRGAAQWEEPRTDVQQCPSIIVLPLPRTSSWLPTNRKSLLGLCYLVLKIKYVCSPLQITFRSQFFDPGNVTGDILLALIYLDATNKASTTVCCQGEIHFNLLEKAYAKQKCDETSILWDTNLVISLSYNRMTYIVLFLM